MATYTENDVLDITKQDRLGEGVAKALFAVAGQHLSEELRLDLESLYNPAGKVTQRSSVQKKVKTITIEAMSGSDSYLRPNGENYFSRAWGEHADVEVLKKARSAGMYVLLYGAPGCGKTALAEAALVKTSTLSSALEIRKSATSLVATPKLRRVVSSG